MYCTCQSTRPPAQNPIIRVTKLRFACLKASSLAGAHGVQWLPAHDSAYQHMQVCSWNGAEGLVRCQECFRHANCTRTLTCSVMQHQLKMHRAAHACLHNKRRLLRLTGGGARDKACGKGSDLLQASATKLLLALLLLPEVASQRQLAPHLMACRPTAGAGATWRGPRRRRLHCILAAGSPRPLDQSSHHVILQISGGAITASTQPVCRGILSALADVGILYIYTISLTNAALWQFS